MRLVVITHLTLDGVMQSNGAPNPRLDHDFDHAGWQVPYLDEEFTNVVDEWTAPADAFLFGRLTYDILAPFWPTVTDPDNHIAARLNDRPKYVVSTTVDQPEWNNTTVLPDATSERIAELKRQPGEELQIHGSGALVQSLMPHRLIDEFRLFIHPVVLGSGQRLFTAGTPPTALELIATQTTRRGVSANTYRPVGAPRYGNTEQT